MSEKFNCVSIPFPGGIAFPEKLNPRIRFSPILGDIPLLCADPPDALILTIPEILNWNPATGILFNIQTSNLLEFKLIEENNFLSITDKGFWIKAKLKINKENIIQEIYDTKIGALKDEKISYFF